MKKIILIITILLLVLQLYSCNKIQDDSVLQSSTIFNETETPVKIEQVTSSVIKIEDKYYLNFSDGNTIEYTGEDSYESANINFATINDFKSTIISNSYTNDQIYNIKKVFRKDSNGIKICDLNTFYAPIMPKDSEILSVGWSGERYGYIISDLKKTYISLMYEIDESYNEIIAYEIEDFYSRPTVNRTKIITEVKDNIEYTINYYTTKYGEFKNIEYQLISEEGIKYTIKEQYWLSHIDSSLSVSEDIPKSIYIFGKGEDLYFYCFMSGLTEKPSLQKILSYGLKKESWNLSDSE